MNTPKVTREDASKNSPPATVEEQWQDWHDTQNDYYLNLLRKRLQEPRLIWVEQFIALIHKYLPEIGQVGTNAIRINDFGCNVGHFYRGCLDFGPRANYKGYDISETYLAIAQEAFGADGFERLDFSVADAHRRIRPADIAVISATLEHVEHDQIALGHVFATTRRLVLLRT
ncbi:MAG: class I SAM-dependent methyltransferase, partial [Magnetococcales bacterium]|nr:class I SAM-dependent methyltransferase [Magnetococcales bacterium]